MPCALSALEALAQASVRWRNAPAWLDRAALHLVDWLACAAAGAHTPQGAAFKRWLDLQAAGHCPTLGGRSADAAAAAAYHGALGSALEMDDVHRSSVLHPGPVVIPAALAACTASTPGAQLLGAMLAGYEVMIRVGRALGPTHYKLWHPTATAGSFGAAAAAAAVMGLDEERTAQALALAGTRAGGLWQVRHETQLGKAWHMAGAAREGLAAAQLATVGLTGPLGVLDGPSGWFAATAPGADTTPIFEDREHPWMADVSFKPWPACRHAHPAMDALREAAVTAPIKHIEVHTYADALRFCDRPTPVDEAQARFSIQHALAAMLHWGEPALAHYRPESLADVQALRSKISLHQDSGIEARYPAHYGARVVVTLSDGTSRRAELQDTYGDPARPMSVAALQNKARMLMGSAGWPEARMLAAFSACAALPTATDLRALNAVIQP